MSESLVLENPINDMRVLLARIHENDRQDIDDIRDFLILYSENSPSENRQEFFESLDIPEIGFEFWEGAFDDLVKSYDDMGGRDCDLVFDVPNIYVVSDWNALEAASKQKKSTRYLRSKVLNVMSNFDTIIDSIDEDRLRDIITEPTFVKAAAEVYAYQECYKHEISKIDEWPKINDEFTVFLLGALGYRYPDSFSEDWQSVSKFGKNPNISKNLSTIAALESERPGATKILSQRYGIRHFSRYSTDFLVNQYDKVDTVLENYGLVISAADDHNGAFSYSKARYVCDDSGEVVGMNGHNLIAVESKNILDLKKRIKSIFEANNGNKISFMIIEAHGAKEQIRLGGTGVYGVISIDSNLDDLKEVFDDRASIVLTGCSSGQQGGVAQHISKELGLRVTAPDRVASTGTLELRKSIMGYEVVPVFLANSTENDYYAQNMVYENGVLIARKSTSDFLGISTE